MANGTQTRLDAFLPKSNTSPRQRSKSWRDEMPEVTETPLDGDPVRVYVLCGVVGSGKSTLAVQWEALYPNNYVRVNQDSLGDRRKCESLARDSLQQGKSPIIDRQNFDPSQRHHWLKIGHAAGVEVVALVFRTTKRTCADRLLLRRGHETVKTPEQGLQVLNSMTAIFTDPKPDEGFHRIVSLPVGLPLHYTISDINALLAKIGETPTLPGILPEETPSSAPRDGFWNRGTAGRGRSAYRGRGQSYSHGAQRSLPWTTTGAPTDSRPASIGSRYVPPHARGADQLLSQRSGSHHVTAGHIGPEHPPRLAQQAARQASEPYPALDTLRHTNNMKPHSVLSARKQVSTGFIDISSDEEK